MIVAGFLFFFFFFCYLFVSGRWVVGRCPWTAIVRVQGVGWKGLGSRVDGACVREREREMKVDRPKVGGGDSKELNYSLEIRSREIGRARYKSGQRSLIRTERNRKRERKSTIEKLGRQLWMDTECCDQMRVKRMRRPCFFFLVDYFS